MSIADRPIEGDRSAFHLISGLCNDRARLRTLSSRVYQVLNGVRDEGRDR
jgi:hypothetical protein